MNTSQTVKYININECITNIFIYIYIFICIRIKYVFTCNYVFTLNMSSHV